MNQKLKCLLALASNARTETPPTVTASLKPLAKPGIARETTALNHGRIYVYDRRLSAH